MRQTDQNPKQVEASRLDAVFAALGDPTRRAILGRLSKGEARVTEVAEPFNMTLNAVSKHIKVLEESGLIRRRIAGREHFLSVNARSLDEASDWVGRMRQFWDERLDALEQAMEDVSGEEDDRGDGK